MKRVINFVVIAIILILIIIPLRSFAHRVLNPTEVLTNNAYNQLASSLVENVFTYSFDNIDDKPGLSFFDPKSDYSAPLDVPEIKAYKRQENLISDVEVLSVSRNNWFHPYTVNISVKFATLVSDAKSSYVANYSGTLIINDKNKKVKSVKLEKSAQGVTDKTIDEKLKDSVPLIQETVSHYLRVKHNYDSNSLNVKETTLYSNEEEQIRYTIARKRSENIASDIKPNVVSLKSDSSSFFDEPKAIVKCEFTTNFNDSGSSITRSYQGYVYLKKTSNGWEIQRDNTFPLNSRFASISLN